MVMANVDRILEVLRQKKSTSVSDLSRSLNLKKEDIQKSAEYLEQDGIIKIEHRWPQVILSLTKDNSQDLSGQQPLPPPPLNEPAPVQPIPQIQQPKPIPEAPSFKPEAGVQDSQTKNLQFQELQNTPNSTNPLKTKPQPHDQKPIPTPLNEDFLDSPKLQPALNPLTQEQQSQISPLPLNTEVNPIFSTPVSNHPNLPPPPIPKNKTFQQSTFNFEGQAKRDTFNIGQDYTKIERPQAEDFISSNSEDDPLNPDKPHFNLEVPSPDGTELKISNESAPLFSNSAEFSSKTIAVPSNKNDMEKIEFLLSRLDKQIDSHDYKEINDFYRKIHSIYMESDSISPNERYLISQKINDMFERIKYLYTVEEI